MKVLPVIDSCELEIKKKKLRKKKVKLELHNAFRSVAGPFFTTVTFYKS